MKIKVDFYNIKDNSLLVEECEKLAYSQHVDNGGTLYYKGLIKGASDYLICAFDENNKLVGFLALTDNYCRINDLYVMQIAVSKNCLRKGVAKKMVNHAIKHSKGYDFFTSHVNKDNDASNALFKSIGCRKIDYGYKNFYCINLKMITDKNGIVEKKMPKM